MVDFDGFDLRPCLKKIVVPWIFWIWILTCINNLEPQTTIYEWMFGETTIFYTKIWNHPNETTIYKWLALGFQEAIITSPNKPSLKLSAPHPQKRFLFLPFGANFGLCLRRHWQFLPGTQMTLVLIGKDLVLGGWPSKIEVIWVPGTWWLNQPLWKTKHRQNGLVHLPPMCRGEHSKKSVQKIIYQHLNQRVPSLNPKGW